MCANSTTNPDDTPEPTGYCECGCGERTTISPYTNRNTGYKKGVPRRFVSGHNARGEPLEERFWKHVDKSGGPDACWPWTGAINPGGYGVFNRGKGQGTTQSSRVAYALTYGEIPDGLFICHRCDFRRCCNPAHLFAGTAADNVRDSMNKGRFRPGYKAPQDGENNNSAKLTTKQVKKIRILWATKKWTVKRLALRFEISVGTIYDIIAGRSRTKE